MKGSKGPFSMMIIFSVVILSVVQRTKSATGQPNIVLIVADDLVNPLFIPKLPYLPTKLRII